MKFCRIGAALIWLSVCQIAAASGLKEYGADDWLVLQKAHAAGTWIVHLWGMSCDPCREELPAWGSFVRGHPQVDVTFIEVEQAVPSVVEAVLGRAGLTGSDQWLSVNGFDDGQRYAIDRHWGGELPLTLLISPDGQVQTLTGTTDFRRLDAWTRVRAKP